MVSTAYFVLLVVANSSSFALESHFNSQSHDTMKEMTKKSNKKIEMDRPIDLIDSLSEQSLKAGQSKEEWLETLREFRDELDIQIENVERELDEQNHKQMSKVKFEVGETVITIKGPKVITEVKKEVLIFGPGEFAPKDRVHKIS